ncbi:MULTISPECIES: cyclic lactone autoinducer peptide [Paenibacillus]|nr:MULTISPECIES: cyclic lactone autoinducer peptide [Paenibacillus]
MKKTLARVASSALGMSALVFATIIKPYIHSPEIPKELRK